MLLSFHLNHSYSDCIIPEMMMFGQVLKHQRLTLKLHKIFFFPSPPPAQSQASSLGEGQTCNPQQITEIIFTIFQNLHNPLYQLLFPIALNYPLFAIVFTQGHGDRLYTTSSLPGLTTTDPLKWRLKRCRIINKEWFSARHGVPWSQEEGLLSNGL